VPLFVGIELHGSSSYTVTPGPRITSIASDIVIQPTVWPQYTNVTDRQTGQRSRTMGRTATCNGRLKTFVTYNRGYIFSLGFLVG